MTTQESRPRIGVSAGRKPSEKTVSVVDRAASMLECFDLQKSTLTLSELSGRMSLPKPTIFRIATILLRVGLLEQNPTNGAYALGFASLRYAENLLAAITIRKAARPTMEALRDEMNETIVLSVRDGDFRYNVDSVESTHAVGQTQKIGVPIPLYAGAGSRVILAAMSQAEAQDYFTRVTLTPFSDNTITEIAELQRQIERARRNGYATTSSEFTIGGYAVACVIPSPADFGLAALHVSIPGARYSKALERKAALSLQSAVAKISAVLVPNQEEAPRS